MLCILAFAGMAGCTTFLANSGPSLRDVQHHAPPEGIQVIDITGPTVARLLETRKTNLFSDVFGAEGPAEYVVRPGDVLEIMIWEAPPATLFSGAVVLGGSGAAPSVGAKIPEQMIDSRGMVNVPFAGQIDAKGRTLHQIEDAIQKRLKDVAHQPQVLVCLTRNVTEGVSVVGEVHKSLHMPLTPRGERLLDALAAAEGVNNPVGKVTIQVTRGDTVSSMPLDTIIRDPRQNILLQPGDVISALFQPLSFTSLGATGKNEEIYFEAQGISLVQALGRAGGLQDYRANPQAVFLFRFEPADLMDWPNKPVMATSDGRVPVIYRADLKDPSVFFASENFQVRDKDLIFISNAPSVEWQKFVSIIMTVGYPAVNSYNAAK